MIYEGKEYKEVTDGSAKIGDLLYIYIQLMVTDGEIGASH